MNYPAKYFTMNCKSFLNLSDWDKAEYMASLIHACQSDEAIFLSGKEMIDLGKRKGLFDKVKFGSDALQPLENKINQNE